MPATDQVHLWFGTSRHRLPGWSAPFVRGGRFSLLQTEVACINPPYARQDGLASPDVRSVRGEDWDVPPLRRAGQASGVKC